MPSSGRPRRSWPATRRSSPVSAAPAERWRFLHPDGRVITADPSPIRTDENVLRSLEEVARQEQRAISGIGSWYDPAAQQIIPCWRGEPFSLHDAVRSLFDWSLPRAA